MAAEEGIKWGAPPVLLCIGGIDPSGGAGLTADVRAAAAFHCHVLPVASAIVVQDTHRVHISEAVAPEIVQAQIETVVADIKPGAVKIGMLPGLGVAQAVVAGLNQLPRGVPIVVDPVLAPSGGPAFLQEAEAEYLATQIMSRATLVTPNIPEAEKLCGLRAANLDEMATVCLKVKEKTGAGAVLLKGGHLETEDKELAAVSVDLLFDGSQFLELRALRSVGYEVRGTGCMLAAAIAAQLAAGLPLAEAVRAAKVWLTAQVREAKMIGSGRRIAV